MITNQAKQIFAIFATGSPRRLTNINNAETGSGIGAANAAMYAFCGTQTQTPAQILTLSSNYCCLEIGYGDTPESASDYNLADPDYLNTKLTCVAFGRSTINTGDILHIYSHFKNNGGSNVTVREVGVFMNPSTSTSTGGNNVVLSFRKVLESPVTIAPGETYAFDYNVRFKS